MEISGQSYSTVTLLSWKEPTEQEVFRAIGLFCPCQESNYILSRIKLWKRETNHFASSSLNDFG